ncbi:MAG: SDR family oxidoreductase [Abitibacteriaceae bacterium]|nr:SDR family oxidoreductase [Abditibacteriaceae bacterium]
MFKLTDKVAVVTGAGSGIGEMIAYRFAEAGALVYVAEMKPESGQAVVEKIKSQGGRAEYVEVDVASESSCQAVAREVLSKGDKRCDILVNNAGIGHVGTVLTTTGEDLDRLYNVNVKGVLYMTQAFLPSMIERQAGAIVNLASIGGIIGIRDRLAYCATKFAVVGITKCVALDHADSKVRVNCICPGRVETPFVQARIQEYPDPKQAYEDMASTQALKRMGRPEEIAAAALYLASDEAAFVTGSALIIDGGWSAGK